MFLPLFALSKRERERGRTNLTNVGPIDDQLLELTLHRWQVRVKNVEHGLENFSTIVFVLQSKRPD